MEFFTIGVYNSTENSFFEKLVESKIDTFCDLRQRRGVRGAKYSFVNSNRLQERLRELNINYLYVRELAPTAEIRDVQKRSDRRNGEAKAARQALAEDFVVEYKKKIVENFDFGGLLESLGKSEAPRIALFCMEEIPSACHRSIVADKLRTDLNCKVTDI